MCFAGCAQAGVDAIIKDELRRPEGAFSIPHKSNGKELTGVAMKDFFKKLLGQSNDAEVRRLQKIADSVLALEDKYKGLSR